jgi:uncharacterized protein YdcH (DUF465 family)
LEAYIIRNFWGEEGFFAVLVENDNVVDKAIEMIVTGKTTCDDRPTMSCRASSTKNTKEACRYK